MCKSIKSDYFHKVNSNDFYPHFVHILEPNFMNKLVLKGDMEVTFAGIVDIGEFNCLEMNLAMNKTDKSFSRDPSQHPVSNQLQHNICLR